MKARLLLLLLAISCSTIAAGGSPKKKDDPRKMELTKQLTAQLQTCREAVIDKAISGRNGERARRTYYNIVEDYFPDSIRAAVWYMKGSTTPDEGRVKYALKHLDSSLPPLYGTTYAVLDTSSIGQRFVFVYRCMWDSKNPDKIESVDSAGFQAL